VSYVAGPDECTRCTVASLDEGHAAFDGNFNYTSVRSFILTGASFITHLRTRNGPIPVGQDRSLEHGWAEIETWMMALAEEALKLQRPLSDGILTIVAIDERNNGTTE
jgi:hypothetical protein